MSDTTKLYDALSEPFSKVNQLREVLSLLESISLEDTPYADYEDDRLNAIDTLQELLGS